MISMLVVIGFSAVGYGLKVLYDKTEQDKHQIIDLNAGDMQTINHKLDMLLSADQPSPYGNFTQKKR